MRRNIFTLFMTVIIVLSCITTVCAEEFDPDKTGSISVTLTERNGNEPIVGAQLSVYLVAKAELGTDGNINYVYTDEFSSINADINDRELTSKIDTFVSQHSVTSRKIITDTEGNAICKNLEKGLYFVKQTGVTEGFSPCTPFIVTVPAKNGDGYIYDVDASPKTEVTRLTSITIKKVWNTDESTEASDSVTVQLLKNGNVIKTATLNAQNNWQVTYTDMPESDTYSIEEINIPKGFTATYKQSGYVFTVTNTSTLIQTGQLIWPIPALAFSGILLITIGIAVLSKKRKPNA